MADDFKTFADELAAAPEGSTQDIIDWWATAYRIVPATPPASPAYLTYTDTGVSIDIPEFYEADVDLESEDFSLENVKLMAAVWADTYRYALTTQPARDEAKELRDAVKQAGTDVPLTDTTADVLVEELGKLGYEITKKGA